MRSRNGALLAVILLLIASSLADAQTRRRYCSDGRSFIVDDQTTIDPCSARSGDGVDRDSTVDRHAQALRNGNNRFEQVVRKMNGILDVAAWLQLRRDTEDGLIVAVDDLHRVLWERIADAQESESGADAEIARLQQLIDNLPRWIGEEETAIGENRSRREDLRLQVRAISSRVAYMERTTRELQRVAAVSEEKARSAKLSVLKWYAVVLPADQRVPTLAQFSGGLFPIPMKIGSTRIFPPYEPEPDRSLSAGAVPQGLRALSLPKAPTLRGTLEQRLNEVERLQPRVRPAIERSQQAQSRLASVKSEHEQLNDRHEALSNENVVLTRAVKTLDKQLHRLQYDATIGQEMLRAAYDSFFYQTAQAYIWSALKEYVVVPELRRTAMAYSVSRPAFELDSAIVEDFYSRGKLHIFRMKKEWSKVASLVELFASTQRLIHMHEGYANDVAILLARRSPAEGEAYISTVFSGLDEQAKREARAALEVANIPRPYKEVWKRLFPHTR